MSLFEGLKVIDCASYIAAPAAATVLSDFGAEVIKVEPLTGDPYRTPGQPLPGSQAQVNPNWLMDSRNKKSLAINIASDEGRAILYKLVKEADVFITNFPPNVRKRLRVSYEDISTLNPRLIYASFTGYGESGPEANKPGFDATVWWARSGLMDLVRASDTAPVRSPPGAGDHPAAMGFYAAIVTALYRREKTGTGSHVGSSLLANGLWANACSVQSALCGDFANPHPPRSEHMMPWRNSFRCSDGKWLMLSIVHNDGRWETFPQGGAIAAARRSALSNHARPQAARRRADIGARQYLCVEDARRMERDPRPARRRVRRLLHDGGRAERRAGEDRRRAGADRRRAHDGLEPILDRGRRQDQAEDALPRLASTMTRCSRLRDITQMKFRSCAPMV